MGTAMRRNEVRRTKVSRATGARRLSPEAQAIQETRVDLAAVHRIVVLENMHEGTWNHFSAKVPGKPGHLLLTPGHTHFSRVTAGSLLMTDPTGRVVEGSGTANISAWAIHAPIHRARPDMACALHAHSPYAAALSSIEGWRFNERAGQHAANFHGRVAYFGYEGIVTDADEGERMAEALGDKMVLFMANHGFLVVGASIELAMLYLYSVERACMVELLAMSTGRPIHAIPADVARSVSKAAPEGFGELGYLRGMRDVLDHQGLDYTR